MAKLILHVGMHKTGSTAIQSSLAAASRDDFVYPRLGEAPVKPHHTDSLMQLFSSKSRKIAARQKSAGKPMRASEDDEERIRRAAAEAGSGTVILSSEGAYSYLNDDDVVRLKRFAQQLFDDVRIIAYVREPLGLISSTFQTRVRGHRLSSFTPKYKSYQLFKKFDDVFGRDQLQLREYDRSKFPNGSVVEDFCAIAGIEPVASTEVNVTISRPALSALYRLNRAIRQNANYQQAFKKARIAIIRHFPHHAWPKFRLSPDVVAPLIRANADDMDWIEERMGRPLRGEQEPRPDDVRSESDLLDIDPRARAPLSALSETLPPSAKILLDRALAA